MGMRRAAVRVTKSALERLGFEVYRPTAFNRILAAQHERSERFFFVQVGANDGVSWDDLYGFATTHPCGGLLFEPVPTYYARLCANYADYPDIIPIQLALHKTQTEATIYRVDPNRLDEVPSWAEGIASLDPNHHLGSGVPSDVIIEEPVRCAPLMQVLDEHKVSHVDLLQIDVEGYDAEVVRMVDFDVLKPAIIKYEHQALSDEDQAQLRELLGTHGYRVFAMGNDTVAVQPDVHVPDLTPPRRRLRRTAASRR